jgi:hypothetical protein
MTDSLRTPAPKRAALVAIRKAHPGNSTMQQCERIMAALSRFAITTFEAMRYLDCYDPRARVMQLRNAGECIDTYWQAITTESGERHRVGLYVLAPKEARQRLLGESP